jgi:hypothetical protein
MRQLEKLVFRLKTMIPFTPVRVPVESSAIKSASYDRHRRSLSVEFQNGGIYEYGSVEPGKFRSLLQADSVGKFFVSNIRNDYPCRKID